MNPTINLMQRMRLLLQQSPNLDRGTYGLWDATMVTLPEYLRQIGRVIQDKVVVDIGCGSGRMWMSPSVKPMFRKFYGVDVIRWNEWTHYANEDKRMAFLQGEVSILNSETHKPAPEVALLKNVLEWNTYSDIRRTLFAIPPSVKTTVITMLENPDYAHSPQHTPFRSFYLTHPALQLPIKEYLRWSDEDQHAQMSVVIGDLAPWRIKQQQTGQWEPCPQCCTNDQPQFAQYLGNAKEEDSIEVMCMSCAFSITGLLEYLGSRFNATPSPNLRETARVLWNSKIINGYSNPEH